MKVGDLVTYGVNLGPHWKKKGLGIVLDVGESGVYVRAMFPTERDESWYHRCNLEIVNDKEVERESSVG